MGFCTVTQTGSAWVIGTLPLGATGTRLIGIAGEGIDCRISDTGTVTFFAGRVPVAGEIVTVSYRPRDRAVARLENAASIAAEAAGGMPGTARWLGKVLRPLARSSADCESAASAVLSFACSRAAAIAGSYVAINPIQPPTRTPGPETSSASPPTAQTLNVVVRQVAIIDGNAFPELLTYRIAFANDWADSLGISLSEAIAPDAFLPPMARPRPPSASPTSSSSQLSAPPQPHCNWIPASALRLAEASRSGCATGTSAPPSTRTSCCAVRFAASRSRDRPRSNATTCACTTRRLRHSTRGSPAQSSPIFRSLRAAQKEQSMTDFEAPC